MKFKHLKYTHNSRQIQYSFNHEIELGDSTRLWPNLIKISCFVLKIGLHRRVSSTRLSKLKRKYQNIKKIVANCLCAKKMKKKVIKPEIHTSNQIKKQLYIQFYRRVRVVSDFFFQLINIQNCARTLYMLKLKTQN